MKNMISCSVSGFLVLMALSACSHQSKSKIKVGEVSLLYQSNRQGTLEPCGCHSHPFGGIDREANAISGIRKQGRATLYVDAGNLYQPAKISVPPSYTKAKSELITRLMNDLALDVYSPGPFDYRLGGTELLSLSKQAHFPFISTNVLGKNGRTLFAPYTILSRQNLKFAFLSLTPVIGISDAQIQDADTALKQWLPEIESKADIIVLLSQLDTKTNTDLAKRYPAIKIVIGADGRTGIHEPYWFGGHTIMVDPYENGYLLGRLDVKFRIPFEGFYSFKAVKRNQRELSAWKNELKKNPANKTAEKYVRYFSSEANSAIIPNGSTYDNEMIELDEKRFGNANSFTEKLAQFRKDLKSLPDEE